MRPEDLKQVAPDYFAALGHLYLKKSSEKTQARCLAVSFLRGKRARCSVPTIDLRSLWIALPGDLCLVSAFP